MDVQLPGFRFHPTEEELLNFYLKNVVFNAKLLHSNIIGFLNIYLHDPWHLPEKANKGQGEREWYFFVERDRKQGANGKANRTTGTGFWKATGSDRPIWSSSTTSAGAKKALGKKKTLVFYEGRAPRGQRTDWVMNEYTLSHSSSLPNKDVVLCKVYRKATSFKVLERKSLMQVQASPPLQDKLGFGVPPKDFGSTFFHNPMISDYQESSDHDKWHKISGLMQQVESLENNQVQDNWSLFAINNLIGTTNCFDFLF